MSRLVEVRDLGLVPYREAHALQLALQEERRAGRGQAVLLLLEHPPVITLGRAHPVPDLRVPPRELPRLGIEVIQTERGGDITYHGPGQLVAYGIIDLRAWDIGVVDYVAGLEDAAIATAGPWGVDAGRRAGARGAWAGERKFASIGVNVRGGVAMHGIALNVDPVMDHFDLINPCGLPGIEMTSLSAEAGTPVAVDEAKTAFMRAFASVFRCEVTAGNAPPSRPGR